MPLQVPFAKAQAVGNDFLVVEWTALAELGYQESDLPELSRRICERHFGVGADGLEVVFPSQTAEAHIRIFNSDASEAEISGNGTRCVAAWLIAERAVPDTLSISTAAGTKALRLLARKGNVFEFEMGMGRPTWKEEEKETEVDAGGWPRTATILNVGNPQCVLFVDDFDFDWRALGAEIEHHPRFPNRTNVSFVKVLDRHTIDARFWERGAGETASSGTGSTGAAVASILTGKTESPVVVKTVAGDMTLDWQGEDARLRGPAVVLAQGVFLDARP
jgi:diaminopimelate epimerase